MTSSDPTKPDERRDSALAFSIMFFAGAVLFAMLGWAQGVRQDTRVMHIPESGGWLIAAAIFVLLGVLLLAWPRGSRKS